MIKGIRFLDISEANLPQFDILREANIDRVPFCIGKHEADFDIEEELLPEELLAELKEYLEQNQLLMLQIAGASEELIEGVKEKMRSKPIGFNKNALRDSGVKIYSEAK